MVVPELRRSPNMPPEGFAADSVLEEGGFELVVPL